MTGLHGFLLVDKPPGITSRRAVDRVIRAARYRGKVGHTGTLDPRATGLLILCFGRATRLAQFLLKEVKAYEACLGLGRETTTGDSEGAVLHEVDQERVRELTVEEVERALQEFRGTFLQVPPAFSARKVQGQRSYRLARRGQAVELPATRVEVMELHCEEWDPPLLRLRIRCSSGTYVRALARDLGRRLGVGAHIESLRRIRVGGYHVDGALPLEELEEIARRGELAGRLRPLESAVEPLPRVDVDRRGAEAIRHGCPLPAALYVGPAPGERAGGATFPLQVQIWEGAEGFLGIGRIDWREDRTVALFPEKVLQV